MCKPSRMGRRLSQVIELHSPTVLKKFLLKTSVFLFVICSQVRTESLHTQEHTYANLSVVQNIGFSLYSCIILQALNYNYIFKNYFHYFTKHCGLLKLINAALALQFKLQNVTMKRVVLLFLRHQLYSIHWTSKIISCIFLCLCYFISTIDDTKCEACLLFTSCSGASTSEILKFFFSLESGAPPPSTFLFNFCVRFRSLCVHMAMQSHAL